MTETITQTKRTELAGDPYGGFLSKKLTVLGGIETTLVALIYADKLPTLPGAIMLASLALGYIVAQAAIDVFKERNRPATTETTTAKA